MAKAKRIGSVDRSRAQQSVFKRTVSSSTIPRRLQSPDGKYFGDVSYDAYKAIEGGTLDSYKPKNKNEKDVIDKFRNHQGYLLQTEDGTKYGYVTYDTYNKLKNGTPENIREQSSDYMAVQSYKDSIGYGKTSGDKKDWMVVSDYKPGPYAMTREEYNLRRGSNPDLPEFGSYAYLVNREKVLAPIMDEIGKDGERQMETYREWAQSYAEGKTKGKPVHEEAKRLYNKFLKQDAIIEEYKNIHLQLQKFETEGVHFKDNGEVDTKSGSDEAKYVSERYKRILWADSLTTEEHLAALYGGADKKTKEKYDYNKSMAGLRSVELEKVDAYDYYDENKNNTYNDSLWGRFAGNYVLGRINIKSNSAGYKSFTASTDDLEASEVYKALSDRIQKRNQATFTNHGKIDNLISIVGQYAPQGVDQAIYKTVGSAVGAGLGFLAGGGTGAKEGARLGGSAASAMYMYEQTAGASYVRLLQEYDLSVDDAKKLAANEALASSTIEFGLDYAISRLWKVVGSATKNTTSKLGINTFKGLTAIGISEKGAKTIIDVAKNAGKLTLNALGEGTEEWIQEGIAITAERYAKAGKSASYLELFANLFDLTQYSKDDFNRMNQNFLAGAIIGFGQGGLNVARSYATNKTISNIASVVEAKKLGKEIIDSPFATTIITDAVEMAKDSGSSNIIKAANRIESDISEGKTPSAKDVGIVVKSALGAKAEQTVVGDKFKDTKTGNAITVTNRDNSLTTVEITTQKGKVITREFFNEQFDEAVNGEHVIKTASGKTATPTTTETSTTTETEATVASTPAETTTPVVDETATKVYNAITSEKLTSKEIDNIIDNPTYKEAFTRLTGVNLNGSKAEQRAAIREWHNNSANIENLKLKNAGLNNAHAKVNQLLAKPNSASIRQIVRSEALTKAFEELTGVKLEGDMDARRATIKEYAELARQRFAEAMENGNALTTESTTSTEAENDTVVEETDEDGKAIAIHKDEPTEAEIKTVVDAMNETFKDGAEEKIYEGIENANKKNNTSLEKSLERFAESLISLYNRVGSLGHIADYFTDNGKKVIAAIEGKTDVVETTETKVESATEEKGVGATTEESSVVEKTKKTESDDFHATDDLTKEPEKTKKVESDAFHTPDDLTTKSTAKTETKDVKETESVKEPIKETKKEETPKNATKKAKATTETEKISETTKTESNTESKSSEVVSENTNAPRGKLVTHKTVNETVATKDLETESEKSTGTKTKSKSTTKGKKADAKVANDITLTRDGEFFKAYGDDAIELSKKLDLVTMTVVKNGVETTMVGFPIRFLDAYAKKLGNSYNIKMVDVKGKATTETTKKTPTKKATSNTTSDTDLENIIKLGSGFIGGRQRIIDFYEGKPSKKEAVEFLKKEYGIGGHSYTFESGASGFVSHDAKGITVDVYDGETKKYSWSEIDTYLRNLFNEERYSLSSIGYSFFGKNDISADEVESMIEDGSYKKFKGYTEYVDSLVNVYMQSRGTTKLNEATKAKAEIERQIEGIMKVAVASARAGYNIFDESNERSLKDSKGRLLFSSLEPNSDYFTSDDISTICDKARNFTEIYEDIIRREEEMNVPVNKRFFNNVDNYFTLHKIMADKGLTIPCDECYVQSMRKNLFPMAKAFIELIQETNPNNKDNAQLYHQEGKEKGSVKKNNAKVRTKVINAFKKSEFKGKESDLQKLTDMSGKALEDFAKDIHEEIGSEESLIKSIDDITIETLTTAEGLARLKLQAPRVYEAFNSFYGQSKPKMPREAVPFRPGELVALLTKVDKNKNKVYIDKKTIEKIKSTGGFRLQSYSDFQIENFVDVLQTIFEAGMLGLNGHAYSKVPAFLQATEGTNLKRNISIFMKNENGKWVIDKKNSFPMELDDIYALVASDESGNTSIIAVSQNADMSAWIMANDNIGYGIPFHKSGVKMEIVRLRDGYENMIDHTKQQSEVYKTDVSTKKKANTKVSNAVNIYKFWDFENKDNLSKKELIEKNLKAYIDECEKRNYRPKFRDYVMNNEDVLNNTLNYAKEMGFVHQNATVDDISFKYGEYTIPYGYYKFIGDFGMFKPDGTVSPIETLSLENYDFDKAVEFFDDSKTLRENELLQQLENGKVRDDYRKMLKDGELTVEQLDGIIREKRKDVANSIVDGEKYSVTDYWHTDLNKDELKLVTEWVRKAGKRESTRITDTANWYKGRLNGKDLFVIYSTESVDNPTILYESSSADARLELELLIRAVEVLESETSVVEKQRDIDAIFKGNWLQEKRNMANNNAGLGVGGIDTGYASVLQGKSSEFIGSNAFRNVIENLFRIQEEINSEAWSMPITDSMKDSVLYERQALYSLNDGEESAIYINDGHKKDGSVVDFANAILDGVKKGETRTHKSLTREWVGIAKDGKVIGRVRLGKPIELHKGTQEYADSLIEGTEYDIKDGQTKYYYPVEEIMDFRDNPKPILRHGNYGVYQLEGDVNNEQRRNDLLSGNSRRRSDESSRKQAERISSFEQKNQGRDAEERQSFAEELLKQGQAEEVIDGKNKYTLVKTEAYNDDMLAMVEEAKSQGIELGFFLGNARIKYDTKDEFAVNGIKKSGSKLLVRYDGYTSPQKILKHETVHSKWSTDEIQTIKDTILNDLTEADKKKILSKSRYSRYKTLYKGDMDAVWEEFVADVMSGMNEYTSKYVDVVSDYWYGNESAEGYSPSTYAESIDAGGEDTDYLKAVESGDMETAQKMVDEAAKDAGYNEIGHHGTGAEFNIFSEEKIGGRNVWGKAFYFGKSKGIADDYASLRERKGGKYRIVSAYLKMENPFMPYKSKIGTAEEILDRWFSDMWTNSRDLGIGYIDGKLENSPIDLLQFIAEHNNVEVRDVLKEYGYDSIKDGGEYVVFDSNQIKSADTVTYDDNGKVIPLSERFNPENNDIRYSLDTDGILDIEDVWNEAIKKYGTTPKGEKTARDIAVQKDGTHSTSGVHYSKDSAENKSKTSGRWATERVDNGKRNKDSKVNIADVVKMIKDNFNIPIATGKVTDRRASGLYKERAEAIRTRIANDLPTISHELGHHLDKLYKLSKLDSVEELRNAVSQEFLDQYPDNKKDLEAVAEFVRIYLKNTDEAKKLCPDFYYDFVGALSKDDLRVVDIIANIANEYYASDFSERVQASIVSGNAKDRTTLSEKAKKMHANWVDGFISIKDVVDYVQETTSESLSGVRNAYTLATNSLNARAISNFNTVHGFRDLNGNIVKGAKSYIECIAYVDKKNLNTLDEYLVLKHSLEWINPKNEEVTKKRVFADDTLEDVESIERRIAEIEKSHPEMINAAENLYEYQRNILKYIVIPAGGMTKDTYNSLNEKYPCYVPFYRAIGKNTAKTKATFANQKSPIKRAKGSGEQIISPLESIINNTDKMIKFALRNQTMQVLSNYADNVDGFGKFMEEVPPDMIPHSVDITKLKKNFEDALQQVTKSAEDYFAVSELLDSVFGDSVTDFTPIVDANKKIVTVLKDGKASYYQVHNEPLYESIAEFTPKQLEGLANLSHKIMQPMKMLITQVNPVFATTNVLRDFGTAYKHSTVNNPLEFAKLYALALKDIIKKDDVYKQWQAMGGGHNSELSADLNQIKATVRRVAQKDMGRARRLLSAILHPVYTTAAINDYVESIPRLMEFKRTIESGGDLQQAIYNADDITTNFKRSGKGSFAKNINALVMFNNASIQGLYKTYRTLTNGNKSERNKTLLKWTMFALLSSAIQAFWNKDDEEEYNNLSSYKKNNFYNFSIGDGKFISIPKARETALLDSFIERTIEYVFGNDDAFYDFGGYVFENLAPPMLPSTLHPVDGAHDFWGSTVLGGIADVGWNKNYMDVPIEGSYDQYLPSNERYNENTTKLAYVLGQTKWARENDLSPKKIDHLLSSYTGILGQANKALFPMNEERRDTTMGLRNKFISDSNYSTDVLNKLYDNKDAAELEWQYDNNINNAIEYEQNVIITSYVSGMNKAIKALPEDKQRDGRKYLLKTLNEWKYEPSKSQTKMKEALEGEEINGDYIFDELPSSELTWTVNKKGYTYQMTPQEYYEYISIYLREVEKARQEVGGDSLESYAEAKELAKKRMSNYKKNVLKPKFLKKSTETE